MSRKRGQLSLDEMEFIRSNADKMPIKDIADKLNRTTEPIKKYINDNGIASIDNIGNLNDEYTELLQSLKKKIYWKELHHQLDSDELNYFASMWVDYMMQFNQDVLASEEYQIKQAALTEILINRVMRKRLLAKQEIERLSKWLDDEYDKPVASQDVAGIAQREASLSLAKTAESNLTNEQNKLMQDSKSIHKDLKATRDQRFSSVESGEKTFGKLIKELYDEERLSRENEAAVLMDKAAALQHTRLGEYHQYGDGTLDMPILSPENVRKQKEKEKQSDEQFRQQEIKL